MKKSGATDSFPLGNPSMSCGDKCFSWLIAPKVKEDFLANNWEKKPLVIKREAAEYFSGIISRRIVENYIKSDPEFAVSSLILTRGSGENKDIQAESPVDIDTFSRMVDEEAFTAQVVHPQQRNAKMHALLERLENWSGTLWGSNMYIKQGRSDEGVFEAFSDNVELFVLQLDGETHWRIFEGDQRLSRDSNTDYAEEDLGPVVLDEVVSAGDLVYIPRGFVHSCTTESGYQYLTLSTYHNQAWCDLLSTAVTETLESVTRSDVEFREGLPINWTSFFGRAVEETDANMSNRNTFKFALKARIEKLIASIDIDEIADQMASDFVALRTPPVVRKRAKSTADNESEGRIFGPDPRLNNDLQIRIRNPSWMRAVIDSDDASGEPKTLIFSCLDNEISNHMRTDNPLEAEPTSLEIAGTKSVEGLKELLKRWPEPSPMEVLSREVLGELWQHGIVETIAADAKKPRLE